MKALKAKEKGKEFRWQSSRGTLNLPHPLNTEQHQIILNNYEIDLRIKNTVCTIGGREHGRCEVWRHELGERKAVVPKGGSPFHRSQEERALNRV